jgi:hypothetical protein
MIFIKVYKLKFLIYFIYKYIMKKGAEIDYATYAVFMRKALSGP